MSTTVEKIVMEALALSPHIRAFLAECLIDSLDVASGAELSEAWRIEIRNRCNEIDEGIVELRDGDGVFARAFASLK